jgi:hypothetical protein
VTRPTTGCRPAPVRGADAAEDHAGEHEQQEAEAHVPADAFSIPRNTPPRAASAAAEHPDDEDDPLHVDAGGLGEVPVVGDGAHGLADLGRGSSSPTPTEDEDRQDDDREVPGGDPDRADSAALHGVVR